MWGGEGQGGEDQGGVGRGELDGRPLMGAGRFFLAAPQKAGLQWSQQKAGLQWSFLKRDYCCASQIPEKLEKRDYSSAKLKRDYFSRKSGTKRRT